MSRFLSMSVRRQIAKRMTRVWADRDASRKMDIMAKIRKGKEAARALAQKDTKL